VNPFDHPPLRLVPGCASPMPTTTDQKTPPKRKKRARNPGSPRAASGASATVIHVAFGNGGGRVVPGANGASQSAASQSKGASGDPGLSGGGSREPVTDVFSQKEVARLLGLSGAQLRSLDKASIVSPTGSRDGKRAYTFQDLIALRATHDLLAKRVKIRDVARAIGALRTTLPRVTRPLQELRIVSDGRRVVVRSQDGSFEPLTGQLVLDFQVNGLREDVVRVLRPDAGARTAYDLYAKASTLDEDPKTWAEAEVLYTKAIHLDPKLAIAYTNLGNIRFRCGDEAGAERLYAEALEVDPKQPEAHYNLGYVMLERGEARRAIPYFEKAISADPRFADAHFNLAMALEQAGDRTRARPHWRRYLELEPTGTWADIARQHL
jgi:DNA-binding transcriptional MerR regulator